MSRYGKGMRDCCDSVAADGTPHIAGCHNRIDPRPSDPTVVIGYTNWRGEYAEREIVPMRPWFGATEWHPEPQWLLKAWDVAKDAVRDFAIKDVGFQRRASVVSPEMVQRFMDSMFGQYTSPGNDQTWVPTNWMETRGKVRAALTAALSVSHKTGDGETKTLPERCPECSLHWGHNPPAIISGSDQVRCIECKSVFPAPTDETQGVKREPVGYVHQDTLSRCAAGYDGPIVGVAAFDTVIPLFSLSQLEAVERERDVMLGVIRRLQDSNSRMAEAFGKLTTRAEAAEASLAAMMEALARYDEALAKRGNGIVAANNCVGDFRAALLAAGENSPK